MIEKFATNTAVSDLADPHRRLDEGVLGIIEGESHQEHIIDMDERGGEGTEPEPGAREILHDHLAARPQLARLRIAGGIGAEQPRAFPIARADDHRHPKHCPAGAADFEGLREVFHRSRRQDFTPVTGVTGQGHRIREIDIESARGHCRSHAVG
jgi:hypothetical protein